MSEPIPESIPTSSDRKSRRPTKKRALTPASQQSAQVDALFANPDREIILPTAAAAAAAASRTQNALAPPEIVANVQGASAGAGSGEFHVYKASRRREYERLRMMDEEVEREKRDKEFEARKEEMRLRDEQKLSKNQAKRAKAKARHEKAEMLRRIEKVESKDRDGSNAAPRDLSKPSTTAESTVKKRLGPSKLSKSTTSDEAVLDGSNGHEPAVEEAGITIHDDD